MNAAFDWCRFSSVLSLVLGLCGALWDFKGGSGSSGAEIAVAIRMPVQTHFWFVYTPNLFDGSLIECGVRFVSAFVDFVHWIRPL